MNLTVKLALGAFIGIICGSILCFSESNKIEDNPHIIITEQKMNDLDKTEIKLNSVITAGAVNLIDDQFEYNISQIKTLANNTYNQATKQKTVEVKKPNVKCVSVSSIEISWEPEDNREYSITYTTDSEYPENIQFVHKYNGLSYLTGLRIDSDYTITIEPIVNKNEKAISYTRTVHTPNPEVIQEFDYIDGWTNCFAGEAASGLTAMPSSGAIYGSYCDTITNTGIRRHQNGDYCCAMGTHFGYCNDRFLVELENGTQFTVRICDSKGCGDVQDEAGYGMWHTFGSSGKCIIEFIWDDGNLPNEVSISGSWGNYNWNGLDLSANIKSIKKLAKY